MHIIRFNHHHPAYRTYAFDRQLVSPLGRTHRPSFTNATDIENDSRLTADTKTLLAQLIGAKDTVFELWLADPYSVRVQIMLPKIPSPGGFTDSDDKIDELVVTAAQAAFAEQAVSLRPHHSLIP